MKISHMISAAVYLAYSILFYTQTAFTKPNSSWQKICAELPEIVMCTREYQPTRCQVSGTQVTASNQCEATHKLQKTICAMKEGAYPKGDIQEMECTPINKEGKATKPVIIKEPK